LLAKLVVHGADRAAAVERMRDALRRTEIEGVVSTVDMHRALLADPEVGAGRVDTAFFARFLDRQHPVAAQHPAATLADA